MFQVNKLMERYGYIDWKNIVFVRDNANKFLDQDRFLKRYLILDLEKDIGICKERILY